MKTSEKERMIKKHLGHNTPKWVINNCLSLLTEFEEKEILKIEPDVVNGDSTEREALHIDSVSVRTLPTEAEVIDTIIECVDIRGIELEHYKRNFKDENSGLITALNKLYAR